ncbi:sperm annulus positionning complex subunit Chibby3 [Ascaphus truei]|uniref:sperm annulus positionning complex subunit Chibby3 n=1 Tax=Ascaphus truei TaxID=8439 RepID=UPI003F5A94E9
MDGHIFCGPFVIQSSIPSRKFKPKKSPVRQTSSMSSLYLLNHRSRLDELGLDYGLPRVQLDNQLCYVFRNGSWVTEGSIRSDSIRSDIQTKSAVKQLVARNKILMEENNYLKLQLDVVMDMLTESTVRLNTSDEQLRSKTSLTDVANN